MGRATALTFAREGASIVGCDVTVEAANATVEMVQAAGGEMVSLQPCHLTDPAACGELVQLAVRAFGRIDVLFNLAARSHFNKLENVTDEEWDAARRDEVDLVFYLTRAAWPHLKASQGVVVNMASLNGSLSYKILPSLAHTTNKAGIIGMTRQLALEGKRARDPRELCLAGSDRKQRDSGGAPERSVVPRDARQDAPGAVRPAGRCRERRAVSRLRREFLRHGHRPRGRWRDEGLVTTSLLRARFALRSDRSEVDAEQ
jgi:hypothetical protein